MEYGREYRERNRIASDSVVSPARAVRPLFAPSDRYPESVASCVLLKLKDQCFVLSAAHAFEPHKKTGLLLGCGSELVPLDGEVYNSARGASGTHDDDPIDAAVLRVTSEVSSEMLASCLSWDDLDLEPLDKDRYFHVLCGFRAKEARVDAATARTHMERFCTSEWGNSAYAQYGRKRERHVLLGYDDQAEVNQQFRTAPSPKGMSGGAIFKILGVPGRPDRPVAVASQVQAKLAAIFIEAHKSQPGKQPALIGTRVNVHVKLISRHFPALGSS